MAPEWPKFGLNRFTYEKTWHPRLVAVHSYVKLQEGRTMVWFKGRSSGQPHKKGESAPMVWCRYFPSNHPYDTVEWFLCWARESDMGHQWTSQFLAMFNEGPWRSFRSKQLGNCWTWCSFTLEDDISHAKSAKTELPIASHVTSCD